MLRDQFFSHFLINLSYTRAPSAADRGYARAKIVQKMSNKKKKTLHSKEFIT
jgi:hypothetical protein